MSRIKTYLKTFGYLSAPIEFVLFIGILTIIGIASEPKNRVEYIVMFILSSPFWLIEWIRKYKYFGDIIFKRLKTNKGKVIANNIATIHRTLKYISLTVVNEENGLSEEFKYFYRIRKKTVTPYMNLESIEFTYLPSSKIIIDILDFKLEEKRRKR
jgi:hypothetical protein